MIANPYDPNQNDPSRYLPPLNNPAEEVFKKERLWSAVINLGIIFLASLVIVIAIVAFQALQSEASRFLDYLAYLFRRAPYLFRDAKAFGAFIQLIAIAVFVGWILRLVRRR